MEMDQKKLAAAMAAVTTYMKTYEAAAAMAAPLPEPTPPPQPCVGGSINTWGITGRQALMQAGNMMQMRMFK
jgi:hypothetical protein